jgi:site-specific DNA-adenine methylase
MKPPYNRIGNKMPIIDTILELIPKHDLYVECFLGSGAVFFNKIPTKSILNDLDKDVIDRLKLLKKGSSNPDDYDFGLDSLNKIKKFYLHHPDTIEAKNCK